MKNPHRAATLMAVNEDLKRKLRRVPHLILQAQEEERKRISRELHDEMTQTLVGIHVHLAALSKAAKDINPALLRKIARTQTLVKKSVSVVQRFARRLRPPVLDHLGLIPALHSYMKEFTMRTGVRVRFTTFSGVEQLSSPLRAMLYRVVVEALINVERHAKASLVSVNLYQAESEVRVEIQDNGKAFDVPRVLRAQKNKRLGLVGMRERVELAGGSFEIQSAPRHGATIRARIPLA